MLEGNENYHGRYQPCHVAFPPKINFTSTLPVRLKRVRPISQLDNEGNVGGNFRGWEGRQNGMASGSQTILPSLPTPYFALKPTFAPKKVRPKSLPNNIGNVRGGARGESRL